jgi:large subunit ribosomal protein L3
MAGKAVVGEKIGMTQIFDATDRSIPVTVVKVSPLRVVQVKTPLKEGYSALQVTFGFRKAGSLSRPEAGHFSHAGVEIGKRLIELRVDDTNGYVIGQEIDASVLEVGSRVDVSAISKGKGFAGSMKRHNFSGQGAGHGNHKKHRAPGSIGACATPARVFKGTKMAGHMGAEKVTTLNLEVIEADKEREIILVKGSVPGPRGGLVIIREAIKGSGK